MSIVSLTVEADKKFRPERVRYGKQVYREFYPVLCTPRKLCCSADKVDS